MDKKKLESRIARLEKLLNGKRKVNERNDELTRALDFVGRAAAKAHNILDDGNLQSDLGDISVWSSNDSVSVAYDNAMDALENLLDEISSAHAINDNEM
jgi:hypothetical protein